MTGRALAVLWPLVSFVLVIATSYALAGGALGFLAFGLIIAALILSNHAALRHVQATDPAPEASPKCDPRD